MTFQVSTQPVFADKILPAYVTVGINRFMVRLDVALPRSPIVINFVAVLTLVLKRDVEMFLLHVQQEVTLVGVRCLADVTSETNLTENLAKFPVLLVITLPETIATRFTDHLVLSNVCHARLREIFGIR